MDLVTAWKSFRQIIRDAQESVGILHGYFRQRDADVWEQTRPLDRNDKKELLSLLTNLESSLSEQTTAEILQGMRELFLPVNVIGEEPGAYRYSDICPCLDRLRDVTQGFASAVMQDAADADLRLRVCPRYLKLCEALHPLTLIEHAYATSTPLVTASKGKGGQTRKFPEVYDYFELNPNASKEDAADHIRRKLRYKGKRWQDDAVASIPRTWKYIRYLRKLTSG